MELQENAVDRLRSSVIRLMSRCKSLDSENSRLAIRCQRQEQELAAANEKIAQLEQQMTGLLLQKSILEVSGSVKSAKQRVNSLLRDIDRCIAMMNK